MGGGWVKRWWRGGATTESVAAEGRKLSLDRQFIYNYFYVSTGKYFRRVSL